jgi:cell division protein ZapA (FtsZ GTPase activity inhibitor)
MSEIFVITVNIDGSSMKMKIPRDEELIYRNAAKLLNERITNFRMKYPNQDLPTVLKMAAFETAVENQSGYFQEDAAPLVEKIGEWTKRIDSIL